MAAFKTFGPLGFIPDIASLDDGTLARRLMPLPGVLCVESRPRCSDREPLWTDVTRDMTIASLFNSCRAPTSGLSDQDFSEAAKALDVEAAAIRAVADVEAKRGAFDELGRPTILFERHVFHKATSGQYAKQHARISNPSAGGYGLFSAQYPKLEEAWKLDAEAALKSTSWGRFQIMGNNFREAGYASVFDFVRASMESESNHLAAFVAFIRSVPAAHGGLKEKNWAKFAAAYNGPDYKKNDYDAKMKTTYEQYLAKEKPAAAETKKP